MCPSKASSTEASILVEGGNDSLSLFFSLETAAVDAPAALAATAGEAAAKITTAPIIKSVLCFLINRLALLHYFFTHPLQNTTSVCVERIRGRALLSGDKKEKEQSSWDNNS